jgi:hypothetical protein
LAAAISNAVSRIVGMIRSPRATLSSVVAHPRSIDLAILVVVVSAACDVGFLLTRVGQLAALDQQVRHLESFGAVVTDERYALLRSLVAYRPAISAAFIIVGWPLLWLLAAALVRAVGNRVVISLPFRQGAQRDAPDPPHITRRPATFAQAFTIVVHASAIFAVRSLVAAPVNYARESIGGATSLGMVMPAFGQSTFPARLLGAVDIFVLWWVVLVAIGLSILYQARTLPIARWLFGVYGIGAVALALTQALRGGI